MVLDELGLDQSNTVIVTGIGCTGRMGSYMKFDAVYTLHGRTLPVAEAIKTVRPELNVIVVAGDGDTASIGGNHLIHAIRRNVRVTVLCNNNEIYGLTGGQTGPTTPSGTKTLSSPAGNPNTPINLQGIVRSSPHALYARTTVYHQPQMRTAIREAIQHDGFAFVDITSQCIENNGRRIGFANANEMLTFYRKTYKRAPKGADRLGPFELGILYPAGHPNGASGTNGQTDGAASGAGDQNDGGARPTAATPIAPAATTTAAPAKPSVSDDEKARKRAESQKRLALMQRLDPAVKLQVAKGEVTLADALRAAGIDPAELEA
jgi:2-oxoglutarate ferredoxin oxidoreductase subunit beta